MTSGFQSPRFISSTISFGSISVLSMGVGLVATVIITRHFSAAEFGVYTLIGVFASFLIQISTFGLELSLSKFIAGAKDESSKASFFGTAVVIRIGSVLLTSLLVWYGNPLLKILFGRSLVPGFIFYVPLLVAVESFRTFLRATLQGSLLFLRMGISDLIASSSNLLLILLIVYSTKGDIGLFILARVFSSVLACIFAFISIPIKKHASFKIAVFKELIKFGYPLQINDILTFIFSRIDTVVVALFLGPVDIAMYEVARKIPDHLRNLFEPFRSVYYPYVSKHYALDGAQQVNTLINNAIRFVAFVTLLGAVIVSLFGREILQLIFSQKYSSSAPIFTLLMVNLSLMLISDVMGTTLVAVGESQKPAIINFFNAVTSCLASFILIPAFAIIGASVAYMIGTVVVFPLNRYFLRKRIDLEDMPYLKPITFFSVWSLLVFIIKPESLLIKAAFLIAYILGCIFLSIITKEDIAPLLAGSRVTSWRHFHKLRLWVSKL